MKQTVRHGLGIALSAMAFLCNYSPWVREAASLPDALTLTSGQKFVVQTGLPMLAASDGGTVSVLASQDERVTISAAAGGQTSVTFSLLGLIPVHETRVNVVEERTLIPGGQAVGVALKTRGVLVVSDAAKGRALRAGDVILSADGKNVESTKALSEQVGTAQTDTVRLEVLRGGQTITVDAQAEPDPSDGRRKLGVLGARQHGGRRHADLYRSGQSGVWRAGSCDRRCGHGQAAGRARRRDSARKHRRRDEGTKRKSGRVERQFPESRGADSAA